MELQTAEWLAAIERDYLASYVREGGAAVKFAIPLDGAAGREALVERMRALAIGAGFVFAAVDARLTRIHLIDRLFFEVARQVDWDALTDGFLTRLLTAQGYQLAEPSGGMPSRSPLQAIAALNQVDVIEFDLRIELLLQEQLYHNYALAYEFRLAMLRLCQARLKPESVYGTLAEPIKQWLRGDLTSLAPLKQARLYKRIARHSARHMLFSLARWTHLAGLSGLVCLLDIGRYTEGIRPPMPDGTLYYSSAATVDTYEVLRQFIDGTDELSHCLIVVAAAPSFLQDDRRGLSRYDALRLRISDEVHDRRRVNPFASLVRLAPGEVAGSRQPAVGEGVE
jgi:hypothetical protein